MFDQFPVSDRNNICDIIQGSKAMDAQEVTTEVAMT